MPQPLDGQTELPIEEGDDATVGETAAAAADAEDDVEVVSTNPEDIEQRHQESRRERARREYKERTERLEALEKGLETHRTETAAQLRSRDELITQLREENARLLGRREGATPAEAEADPADLRRKARDALKAENLDEYERLRDEATRIEMRREMRAELGQVQRQIPQKPTAEAERARLHIDSLMVSHKAVRAKGNDGWALVQAKYTELGVTDGMAHGPDRMEKAFELAEQQLSQRSAKPSYDRSSRAALSGSPNGASSGDDEEKRELSPLEKKMARLARMSEDEYRKFM